MFRFKQSKDAMKVIEDTKTGDSFLCYNEDIAAELADHLNHENIGVSTSNIYEMTPIELIRNKDQLVIDYNNFMKNYREKEAKLLIETDFKAVGCTNEKQRTAYVNQEMAIEKLARASYEHSIDIVNDLLRLRIKEVKPK